MELLRETLNVIGTILIAFTVIMVHQRILYEHKIDARVFKSMKREQKLAVSGVIFIIAGYIIQFF